MIEVTHGVPAHIALLLNEKLPVDDPRKLARRINAMRKDLLAQAEASIELKIARPKLDPREFRIVLGGGLDLFSGEGACSEPECRTMHAEQIARSIAIMGDSMYLHDHLYRWIFDLHDKQVGKLALEKAVADVQVLYQLQPLIAAGIVNFLPTWQNICEGCLGEFNREVARITEDLVATFSGEIILEEDPDGDTFINTGTLFTPPVGFSGPASLRQDESFPSALVRNYVRTALWEARDAMQVRGALFSNSRIGISGVLAADGWTSNRDALRTLEGQRAGKLPWVSDLSIEQTLVLRQEAAKALPAFRELLAKNLNANPEPESPGSSSDFIDELREQAIEVRGELDRVSSTRRTVGKTGLGVISLGISALGVASGVMTPIVAAGQLAGTLGLLHTANLKDHDAEEAAKAKPGFVLVAAQDILAHAN